MGHYLVMVTINPFPNDKFWTLLHRKKLADDKISKLMKMAESSSKKRVKNAVGKGELARFEQVLLFPQCFHKSCTADT